MPSTPSNINGLSPIGFQLSILKLPEVSYFSQSISLPGISLPAVEQATPFSNPYVAGDKLEYEELTLQFMINENMSNYKSIHNWLVGLSTPENYNQYNNFISSPVSGQKSELSKHYSDGVLSILNSSNNSNQIIRFIDMLPTSLQTLSFNTTSTDVEYLTGLATFRYSYYYFE